MSPNRISFKDSLRSPPDIAAGIFLHDAVPSSLVEFITSRTSPSYNQSLHSSSSPPPRRLGDFLSVSLSTKGGNLPDNGEGKKRIVRLRGKRGAINTTKHLWAGAVAAMVSRSLLFAFMHHFSLTYCF